MLKLMKRAVVVGVVAGASVLGASSAMAETRIHGEGATFPAPFYLRQAAEYQKLHEDVKVDYNANGSGAGIKAITDKTTDFAGSDAPMNAKEIEAAGGADNLIEIPMCAGGVVPGYNVPGVDKEIQFTGEVLAEIYMGKITHWNDPKLIAINPDIKLPDLGIVPVWRADASGTTFVYTSYLSTQSADFKGTIGPGKDVKWTAPQGQSGKGSAGVAAVVKDTKGAIGYFEQNYASQNKITFGMVKNKSGKFVKATPASVSAAGAASVKELKGNLLVANLWNLEGEKVYPVSTFTYLILYKDLKNVKSKEQAEALVKYVWWATHEGQKFADELEYASLAKPVQEKVEAALNSLTYQGASIKLASN